MNSISLRKPSDNNKYFPLLSSYQAFKRCTVYLFVFLSQKQIYTDMYY